ncbi:nucleoside/nucleotide kinase family protein [Cellulomonas sp. HZM]|uniref:nucleoside/nucleotide kinase family protein n=1 Tax=Cellulomonas sp. HZM TaxID=1454010 RepID=UPI00069016F1|nr:nucleoside/nucleotide kinase family protein [Cellulomonas sp. HZM]
MTAEVELSELVEAARSLVVPGERHVLGITGAPGSGKSTLAEAITSALGDDAAFVALDGFHLADAELHRLGRHPRKGAEDTFDAAGYVNLLRRLRARTEVVYAPVFDRGLEAAIAGSVAVGTDVPLIVTEGNYLLVDAPVWRDVRPLLDACWYVDPGEDVRIERLVARHMRFGRSPQEARERSLGSDQRNAELIAATRQSADRVVRPAPSTEVSEATA